MQHLVNPARPSYIIARLLLPVKLSRHFLGHRSMGAGCTRVTITINSGCTALCKVFGADVRVARPAGLCSRQEHRISGDDPFCYWDLSTCWVLSFLWRITAEKRKKGVEGCHTRLSISPSREVFGSGSNSVGRTLSESVLRCRRLLHNTYVRIIRPGSEQTVDTFSSPPNKYAQ